MSVQVFGSCCAELDRAMTAPPNSLFRFEENGVLYLTVGYAQTPQGTSWFDQAVIYCPFCGSQLQNLDDIRRKAHHDERIH